MDEPQNDLGSARQDTGSNGGDSPGKDHEYPTTLVSLSGDILTFNGDTQVERDSEMFGNMAVNCESGFSISFWVYPEAKSSDEGRQRVLMHKGHNYDDFTPTIGISENSTVFCKFSTKRNRLETLYTERKLKNNKWIFVAVVFETQDKITEVSIYLNGLLDAQVSVFSSPVFNDGSLYMGKDPWNDGFIGKMSRPLFFFRSLAQPDIKHMHSEGHKPEGYLEGFEEELQASHGYQNETMNQHQSMGSTTAAGGKKKKALPSILQKTYGSPKKKKPISDLGDGPVDDDGGDNANHESVMLPLVEPDLYQIFDEYPHLYPVASALVECYDWIYTVLSVLSSADRSAPNFREKQARFKPESAHIFIELVRLIKVIQPLKLEVKKDDVILLAQLCYCYNEYRPANSDATKPIWTPCVLYHNLFTFLYKKFYPSGAESERSIDVTAGQDGGQKSDAGDGQGDQEEELPSPDDGWNQGAIEIVINRCYKCVDHQTTTKHNEGVYMDAFNEMGEAICEYFPNASIVGNYDAFDKLGRFEIYLRGVGPAEERDSQGRYPLFSKMKSKRFPRKREITDKLVILAFCHGDSQKLQEFQEDFREGHRVPAPWSESHGFPFQKTGNPASLGYVEPVQLEIERKSDVKMRCRNWACGGQIFSEETNSKEACLYHPGRWEFGSVHGLWPECWTCCRGDWESQGCAYGAHRGYVKDNYPLLCVNHGKVNPQTNKVDAFCGDRFFEKDNGSDACKSHSGYLRAVGGDRYWTCCRESEEVFEPCESQAHRAVEWPDPEAKKYFYSKPVKVMSEGEASNMKKDSFKSVGKTTLFFKPVQEYNAIENAHREKLKRDKETEEMARVCVHWACHRQFTAKGNTDRSCLSHNGVWDFGHSGISVQQVIANRDKDVMWKPHWTCCRGEWLAEGCSRSKHKGPLVEDSAGKVRKFTWPDERAQVFFRKIVSPAWRQKLEEQHTYSRPQVSRLFNEFAGDNGIQGQLRTDALPALCDRLKLHLLVCSDDISYQFKFQDVVCEERIAERIVDDGSGFIDKDKFLAWWFAPIQDIRPGD